MSSPDGLLFWVAPRNGPASEALRNVENRQWVAPMTELEEAFMVGFSACPSQTHGCLLTIGHNGDIEISGSLISAIHCQVLLNPSAREILLRDKSAYGNTKIELRSSLDSLYFSTQTPRQVVLRYGDNIHLGMDGDN
jgi:hypothetical protein